MPPAAISRPSRRAPKGVDPLVWKRALLEAGDDARRLLPQKDGAVVVVRPTSR